MDIGMDMEFTLIHQEIFTKENGKIVKNMVKVYGISKMDQLEKEFFRITLR